MNYFLDTCTYTTHARAHTQTQTHADTHVRAHGGGGALTWALLMSLAEGLEASGLGSSESEAKQGLKQGQVGLGREPGTDTHTGQEWPRTAAELAAVSAAWAFWESF